MAALSSKVSVKLNPRQYCALRLFVAANRSVSNAAEKIGIAKMKLWRIVENRSGSEFAIFTILAVIEPFMENLIADKILNEITEHWRSVGIDDLNSKQERRQSSTVVEAKQVACYLMSKYTKLSYLLIAEKTGYKDNKMVIWGVDKITSTLEVDKQLKDKVAAIEETINKLFQ